MGILNLTSDSFFPASRTPDAGAAVAKGLDMLRQGADALDLGAVSTRPGSEPVPEDVEQARLLPVLAALRAQTEAPLSVDTFRAATARLALDAGADAVNDVTAGRDPQMFPLLAGRNGGLILMHMRGEPRTMQVEPRYDDVVGEVTAWLAERVARAVAAGIARQRIVVDPGIGFGKRLEHNLALLGSLDRLGGDRPLLLGASRKSFIGDLTGAAVADRLGGSLAALAVAQRCGAFAVRVHDVAESVQCLDVLAAIAAARDGARRAGV